MESNPRLTELTDRQLLELIISNQTNLFQIISRMNHFNIALHGKEYIDNMENKDESFEKLLNQHQSLLQQLRRADIDRKQKGI